MPEAQREARARVLLDTEGGVHETIEPMALAALAAVSSLELAGMRVRVAAGAGCKLQLAVAPSARAFGRMTAHARGVLVLAEQWIARLLVHAPPERFGQTEPSDRGMALGTIVAKLGEVHGRMTTDAAA